MVLGLVCSWVREASIPVRGRWLSLRLTWAVWHSQTAVSKTLVLRQKHESPQTNLAQFELCLKSVNPKERRARECLILIGMSQVFYHQEHLKYALPPRVKPKKWRSLTVLNNISPGPIHFVATLLGEDQPNQATSQSALPFYQAV